MVHVFLPSGQRLRLRLFPKPKSLQTNKGKEPKGKKSKESDDDAPPGLFAPGSRDAAVEAASEKMAARIVEACLVNRVNAEILSRFPKLGIRDWWLTSGCIAQTVWNMRTGRPAAEGINDYDVVYFAEDPSVEAEDQVIRDAVKLFGDLPATVQVRNQARVHLWYPDKYGIAYSPLTTASEGILRFPSTTTAVGIKRTGDDFLDVYAPFGLGNLWDMIVKPNRALPLSAVYQEKALRWQQQWPRLIVRPWVLEEEQGG